MTATCVGRAIPRGPVPFSRSSGSEAPPSRHTRAALQTAPSAAEGKKVLETRHHPEQMGQMELQGGEAPGGDGFWQARIPASVTPLVRGCPFTWLASRFPICTWRLPLGITRDRPSTRHPHPRPGLCFCVAFCFLRWEQEQKLPHCHQQAENYKLGPPSSLQADPPESIGRV